MALTTAAFLLVGLPAGALVDRVRRRGVLIIGDLGRAVLLASVPAAWWAGVLTIWHLYAVALLLGVFTVFFDAGASGGHDRVSAGVVGYNVTQVSFRQALTPDGCSGG